MMSNRRPSSNLISGHLWCHPSGGKDRVVVASALRELFPLFGLPAPRLPFVGICSGPIRHWNRLKIHLWRARPYNGVRHRFAGFCVFRIAHHLVPFQLKNEPVGVGKVPDEEAL